MSPSKQPPASHENDGTWQSASTAPYDRDLELAVIDGEGAHALAFPCRRVLGGWMNVKTNEVLTRLLPSHWREWHGD